MKQTTTLFILLSWLFIACNPNNNDDPGNGNNGTTTVEQDKEFINAKVTETLNCINNIKDGESIKALVNFLQLNAGDIQNEAWLETMTAALEETPLNNIQIDEENKYRFNFSNFTGEYSWDAFNEQFNFSSNSNSIVINFPSSPDQTSNNIRITLSKYQDNLFQVNAENIFLPTAIIANITKDGKEIFSLNYSGEYNTMDFPTPQKINLVLNLNPQTISLSIAQASPTKFNVELIQQSGSDCKTELKSTIDFANSDFKNFEENNDVNSVTLSIIRGDLNIKGFLDPQSINDIEDPSTAQINNAFTCEILNNNNKIGDLKFKDVDGERKVFIIYKDFSSEEVTIYTDRFLDGLEQILEPYFGTIDNDQDWF
jgi:hypothetical protein